MIKETAIPLNSNQHQVLWPAIWYRGAGWHARRSGPTVTTKKQQNLTHFASKITTNTDNDAPPLITPLVSATLGVGDGPGVGFEGVGFEGVGFEGVGFEGVGF